MSVKTLAKSRVAKAIRHVEFLLCGIHLFEMGGSKQGVKWVQEVDIHSLSCECSCPNFLIRHAKHEPKIYDASHLCKHLHSAVEWLLDSGDITEYDLSLAAFVETLNPCACCAMPDAEIVVYDESAHHITGRMCSVCFEAKSRTHYDQDTLLIRDEIERLTAMRDALQAEGDGLESAPGEIAGLNALLAPLWREYMACEPLKEDV